MKKTAVILATLLIILSACSTSKYEKTIDKVKDNLDEMNGDSYILGYDSDEELDARNKLHELYEIDFELKNAYYINYVDNYNVLELTVLEYSGDIDDYMDVKEIEAICVIDSNIAITEQFDNIEDVCDDIDGKIID